MKTILRQVEGSTFAALADSGHWAVLDTSAKEGGADGASGPMEMVLNALGACSAIDILLILQKMRVTPADLQINIEAERAEEPPRVFTKVHLEYILTGSDMRAKDVERAIELSMSKYCSVAGMVRETAEITTSFKIVEP